MCIPESGKNAVDDTRLFSVLLVMFQCGMFSLLYADKFIIQYFRKVLVSL